MLNRIIEEYSLKLLIMPDGNRRWAKEKGFGFEKGYQQIPITIAKTIDALKEKNIDELYFWCNSINNLSRPEEQVESYLRNYLEIEKYALEKEIKIILKGNIPLFPKKFFEKFKELEAKTYGHEKFKLYYFLNYETRDDIIRAQKKTTNLKSLFENMDEPSNLNILIRTGGSERLSGFTPIKSDNMHIYFLEEFFPDLKKSTLQKIIDSYKKINFNNGK